MTPVDTNTTVVATYCQNQLKLEDDAWLYCKPVHITRHWSGTDAPASRHAEARLTWNERELTVRFVCEQHEPLIVNDHPVTNMKTVGLWDRDVCEIFLAPDVSNTNDYFEFEAAPNGEWIDLALHITPGGRETEWDYSSGMSTRHKVEGDRTTISITIPWSERLPKPSAGDEWRANLFRCVGPDEATRYLAWRPTQTPEPNYHVPEAFGVLRFE
jgi:alpha-galactosidase